MQVWRHLLKRIDSFTSARLKELVEFGRSESSFEMMAAEVVKEVASRFKIFLTVGAHGNNYLHCSKKGAKTRVRSLFKVTISIQGWGTPVTFEIGGEEHLKELNRIAQTVRAKFTIREVKAFEPLEFGRSRSVEESYELIATLVDLQGEEGLEKLDLPSVMLYPYSQQNPSLSLLKASKEWKIETLSIGLAIQTGFSHPHARIWRALARSAATGHIGSIKFRVNKGNAEDKQGHKENVKAVWEIAEKLEVVVIDNDFPGTLTLIGGGRGEEPKTTWEEAYETVLNNIC